MHHLDSLLQNQLATDATAFVHLPTVLTSLKADQLLPSPHIGKWTARITTLMRSREPSSRWAGLSLAKATSELSTSITVDHAQGWLAIALPFLAREEPAPILSVTICFILHMIVSTTGKLEFQRQVLLPNIPKFASGVLEIVEKNKNVDTTTVSIIALRCLVTSHPTLLKPLQGRIMKAGLVLLSGSFPTPAAQRIVEPVALLVADLHSTGGKVGGIVMWKTTMESSIGEAENALVAMRSTFGEGIGSSTQTLNFPSYPPDPMISIPLALDRLRCVSKVICALLRVSTIRPVPLPIGRLVHLTRRLLLGHPDIAQLHGFFDLSQRALEISLVPETLHIGCDLLICMTQCTQQYLAPYASTLLGIVASHLAAIPSPSSLRYSILKLVPPLLMHIQTTHSQIVLSRLCRSILPSVTCLLDTSPGGSSELGVDGADLNVSNGRKAKKRARAYEGDEVFRGNKDTLSPEERSEVIIALDALQVLLGSGLLSNTVKSMTDRIMLSLLLLVSNQIPNSSLSKSQFQIQIVSRVTTICCEQAIRGSGGWATRGLGSIVRCSSDIRRSLLIHTRSQVDNQIELALHPRLLPWLKTLPATEALSLFRNEESKEEKTLQEELNLSTIQATAPPLSFGGELAVGQITDSTVSHAPIIEQRKETRLITTNLIQEPISNKIHFHSASQTFSSDTTIMAFGASKQVSTPASESVLEGDAALLVGVPRPQGNSSYQVQVTEATLREDSVTITEGAVLDRGPTPELSDEDEDMPTIDIRSESDLSEAEP